MSRLPRPVPLPRPSSGRNRDRTTAASALRPGFRGVRAAGGRGRRASAGRRRDGGGVRAVTGESYLLDGLWCMRCRRWMRPTSVVPGGRRYRCGTPCPQPDVAAGCVESDLVLRASLRAMVTLHPDLARDTYIGASLEHLADWDATGRHRPDPDQVRHWHSVNLHDHRELLHAAFLRVDVDRAGRVVPVWRHRLRGAAFRSCVAGSGPSARLRASPCPWHTSTNVRPRSRSEPRTRPDSGPTP